MNAWFDPLFITPFLAGLPLALILPWLGNLLRLRDEWLAALGLAHLASAGALAGLAAGLPAVLGAPLGALLGAAGKSRLSRAGPEGNSAYGAMILAGWAITLLIAANTPLGDSLAHAVVDGQLYFAGRRELIAGWSVALLALVALPWLAPRLIRARFFPSHERANHQPAWRWHLGFDLLAGLAIAVATASLGLMAAFALIFLPARVAFRLAPDWRRAGRLAVSLGGVAYLLAFALALALDQPFGPVMVAVLLLVAIISEFVRMRQTSP